MTALTLVIIVLIVIGSIITVVLIAIATSGLIQAHRVRLEPLLSDARDAIIAALSGGESRVDEAFASLSGFSRRYIVSVMLDLAPSVSGTSREVLVSLGEKIGVIQRAHRGLRRRRWSTRLYSARVLSAFGVESERLSTLLTDRSAEVRAQTAAWSVVKPDPLTIQRLMGLLDDVDGLCRFAAQDAFIRIGLPGTEALIGALETANEDVTGRILQIASATGDERFYPSALVRSTDSSPKTRALAAAVLAHTGNPSAGPDLVALLNDPSDDVVLAAAAGLETLSYWPAAADVEPLLGHPVWELRKQAGLTLLALGAPGSIFLRANAPGDGPAAAMALQVLELRSLADQAEAA
jgi:HEAT repeat protein